MQRSEVARGGWRVEVTFKEVDSGMMTVLLDELYQDPLGVPLCSDQCH